MKATILEISPKRDEISPKIASVSGYFPIWQSFFWNAFLLRSGWEKKGFFVSMESISGFFELRSIGFGFFGLFCIGGPIVTGKNIDTTAFSNAVLNLWRSIGAVFIQIEPISEVEIPGFSKGEYRHFLEKRTLLIDLSKTEDAILAQMKEKGRYNIRLSEKRGVSVRMVEPTEKNVAEFVRLLNETLVRDGFSGNSSKYYLELIQTLEYENAGGLFFAEKNGEVVAASIASFYAGTAVYYYGASTSDNEKRRDMPAYALQWGMIREAKRRGCTIYDFLGIAPEGDWDHPLMGVTDFKLKFGGEIRQWPENRVMVLRKYVYFALKSTRRIRKVFS